MRYKHCQRLPDPGPYWPPTPADHKPSYDVLVDTNEQAEDKLREVLDGDGDKILEAMDLLDLNTAVIQMIIDNSEKFIKEPEKPYGQAYYELDGLYEKLTGKSLGIKENF